MSPSARRRALARAAKLVPALKRVPVLRLLAAAELVLLARDHAARLTPAERRRLVALVRIGRGRRRNLSPEQQEELTALIAKTEPRALVGTAAERLSPVPLPRRLLYGRRAGR